MKSVREIPNYGLPLGTGQNLWPGGEGVEEGEEGRRFTGFLAPKKGVYSL